MDAIARLAVIFTQNIKFFKSLIILTLINHTNIKMWLQMMAGNFVQCKLKIVFQIYTPI